MASKLLELSEDIFQIFDTMASRRVFRAGEHVVMEGDSSSEIFLLTVGRLKVYSNGKNDRIVVYGILHPREVFGEISLDGGPCSASIKAESESECLVLNERQISQLIENSSKFNAWIVLTLCTRLRAATTGIRRLSLNNVYERVASLLEDSAVQCGEEEYLLPPELTHAEIAARVGATREMVGNILRSLIIGGFISRADNRQLRLIKKLPEKW